MCQIERQTDICAFLFSFWKETVIQINGGTMIELVNFGFGSFHF